jgi:cytochrome b6-f complex iron-sulfur subunit
LNTEDKFKCPCHGSGFRGFSSGWKVIATNFEGPAPRPLERFKLTVADDGQIQVDKGVVFRLDKDESEKPGAFLPYA